MTNNTIEAIGGENAGLNITASSANIDNITIIENTIRSVECGITVQSKIFNMSNIKIYNNTIELITVVISLVRSPTTDYQFVNVTIIENI